MATKDHNLQQNFEKLNLGEDPSKSSLPGSPSSTKFRDPVASAATSKNSANSLSSTPSEILHMMEVFSTHMTQQTQVYQQQMEAMRFEHDQWRREILNTNNLPRTDFDNSRRAKASLEGPFDIPNLKGTENSETVRIFLQRVKQEGSLRAFEDDELIYIAKKRLQDKIKFWYEGCERNGIVWKNFNNFADALSSACEKWSEDPLEDRDFLNLQQYQGTVTRFTQRFKELLDVISHELRSDSKFLCLKYKTGLSEYLYLQARSHKFETWEDVSEWALGVEKSLSIQKQGPRTIAHPKSNSNQSFQNHTGNSSKNGRGHR